MTSNPRDPAVEAAQRAVGHPIPLPHMTDRVGGSPHLNQLTEVLRQHQVFVSPIRSYPRTFKCRCGEWTVQAEDGQDQHAAHVAGVVLAALNLTEEWGTGDGGGKPIQTGWDEAGARAWEARRGRVPWVRVVGSWRSTSGGDN